MDAVFQALASGARREILERLAGGEYAVGELADLVRQTVVGRRHLCRLEPLPLSSASTWLRFYERHWQERLDSLESFLLPDSTIDTEDQ